MLKFIRIFALSFIFDAKTNASGEIYFSMLIAEKKLCDFAANSNILA